MPIYSKFKKLGLAVGAVSSLSALYYLNGNEKVFASWTNHYEPSPFAKWNDNWDYRGSLSVENKRSAKKDENNNNTNGSLKPKACRHLILIRHGQYNLDGTTDEERQLTKLGRLQAEYTGKRLKELNLPYNDIVKSTMTRAQETGTIISSFLPQVPVSHCSLLREGAPVPPEPPLGSYRPESQQFFQDGARIEAAFRKYFYRADLKQEKDSYIILVCHANVIRYLVCRVLQFPAEAWLRMSLYHASITWVSITPSGRCVLRTFGDSGHIPPEALTTS